MRVDARIIHVEIDGETIQCTPRGRLFKEETEDKPEGGEMKNPIAVGDQVSVGHDGNPPGVEAVLPRRNALVRVASSHDPRGQVLCANVDQLLVVGSLQEPRFSSNRTDRILSACHHANITTGLVLNKTDLDRDGSAEEIAATYRAAGMEVLLTSAKESSGLEAFAELLRGKTTVLYGASGGGKSTLINGIQPGLDLKTARISAHWNTGRHTTSYSQLHRVEAVDGWVVDTPGIRTFRLFGLNNLQLRETYPEFAAYADQCHFPNCAHDHEPDCAIFDAVEAGKIAPTRYASYVEILDELAPPPDDAGTVLPPEEAGFE